MSLRFCDSFDHYNSSDLNFTGNGSKYTSNSGLGTWNIFSPGRFGSCLRLYITGNNSGSQYLTKGFDNQATWIIGFAFRTNQIETKQIVNLFDTGSIQCDLRLLSNGSLSVTRNGTALTNGVSTATISPNTWYYIEWMCTISNSISANTCQVNLNGANIINVATGQNVRSTANNFANQVVFGVNNINTSGVDTMDYDDLYILDGVSSGITGALNNAFLGDIRVEARFPSAAGTNTDWTANGATAVSCINNQTPDGDATFLSDATANHISTFTLPVLSSTPSSIFGVVINHNSRKTDAGTRQIADEIRSSSANYVGTTVNLANSYVNYQGIWQSDPATSAAWGTSGANAMEAGVKEIT